jgi:hypothetical protein
MRYRELKVAALCISILAIQVLWHWFLSVQCCLAPTLRRVYLYRGHQSVAGYLDLMLPGFLMGITIGRVGWEWSVRKVSLFVLLAGISLVAILPVYVAVLGPQPVWWWLAAQGRFPFVGQCFKAWVTVGFFACGGRAFGEAKVQRAQAVKG